MTRPKNIVIAIATLVVGFILVENLQARNPISIVLLALGFAFAIGYANIENDILDYESDKANRPERALPSGLISRGNAQLSAILFCIISVICGITDSIIEDCYTPALFFTCLSILLTFYNRKLKHIPLLKNMTVAFLCSTPLILVFLLNMNEYTLWRLSPAAIFAIFLTTAREIYKDMEDELGDLKAGIMTFPLIAGMDTARRLAGAIIIFNWLILPFPVLCEIYPTLFVILAESILTPIFAATIILARKKKYRRAQKLTKIAMFTGLVDLIICAIAQTKLKPSVDDGLGYKKNSH